VHGAALVAFLGGLRIDKIIVVRLRPSAWDWATLLASEVGLALLIQAAWMITIRVRRPWLARTWLPAYVLFHLPIYAVAIVNHRFFYETMHTAKLSMIVYALREFRTVRGLLATGIDASFFAIVAAAVVCISSAVVAWRRRHPWRLGQSVALPASLTLAGAALVMWPVKPDIVSAQFAGNFLMDLLPHPEVQKYMDRNVPVFDLYSSPKLVDTATPADTSTPTVPARRPSFLFVVLESTRRDLLNAYTHRGSKMPFVDELAKEGIVVDDAYTTVSHTTKALVGIHCGMHPVMAMRLVEAIPGKLPLRCLPELLGEAGYETAFFQSAGNFEHRRDLTENLEFQHRFVPTNKDVQEFARSGYLGWEENALVEPVVTWITSREGPYFATLLTLSTHHPYHSPTGGRPPSMSEARGYYDSAARYVDGVLRRLFERLAKSGALDDTVVVVTGDHGEAFGERIGYRQHDIVPYEDVTHVPLVVHAPKRLGAPRRLAGIRHHVDLLPTVLELAGLKWEGRLPGASMLTAPGHEFVVSSCWFTLSCLSLRYENLSFVFHYGRVPLEVYDLARDPAQTRDIVSLIDPTMQENAIDLMLGTQTSVNVAYAKLWGGGEEAR
jgi:lipoteichoic acid synthase